MKYFCLVHVCNVFFFFVKGQVVNILDFTGFKVSVYTIQFYSRVGKAAIGYV